MGLRLAKTSVADQIQTRAPAAPPTLFSFDDSADTRGITIINLEMPQDYTAGAR